MKRFRWIGLLLLLVLISGCTIRGREVDLSGEGGRGSEAFESPEEEEENRQEKESHSKDEKISESEEETAEANELAASLLSSMTKEEKAAQLLIVKPELLTGYEIVTASGDVTKEAFSKLPVCGFYYSARNFEEQKQVRQMLSRALGFSLKRYGIPMFFAADEEGLGQLERIAEELGEEAPNYKDYLEAYGFFEDQLPFTAELSSMEQAAETIENGADCVILTEGDPAAARDFILSALISGALSEERFEKAVRRVLAKKTAWTEEYVGLPDETEEGELFYFADASNLWYQTYLDPSLPRNDYSEELFRREDGVFTGGNEKYHLRKGVDVSHHSGDIDWKAVKEEGYDFAFLRIGYRGYGEEGALKTDREFQDNYALATEAGLDLGVYIFSQAINTTEAEEEANLVLQELDGRPLALPVVYDPESIKNDEARTDDLTGEQATENTRAFCDVIRAAGYEVGVYSNMIWEAFMLDLSKLSDIPIWYADYEPCPQSPYPFTFWQYTESGTVSGINGEVDLDLWIVPG